MLASRFDLGALDRAFFWDGPTEDYIWTDPAINRIDTISSSNASDTLDVFINGLDENWVLVDQIVTLDGQNKVGLNPELIRFNTATTAFSGNLAGEVYIYEDTPITLGVPDDPTKVKGYIDPAKNISNNLHFSVPAGSILNVKRVKVWNVPSTACCMALEFYTKYDNGADVLILEAGVVDGGNTELDIEVVATATFPEKSDLYAYISGTTPGAGASSITEFELVRV
jgi:hypothetical protein